jgi:hypothetical protein
MRSVRVIRHANQVQYVGLQEDHPFLSPLSPSPFDFGYKCFWLYRCILTSGTFSRSLAHSPQDTLYNENLFFSPPTEGCKLPCH